MVIIYFLSFGKLLLVLPKLLLVQVKFCEPGATFTKNLLLVPVTLFQGLLSARPCTYGSTTMPLLFCEESLFFIGAFCFLFCIFFFT